MTDVTAARARLAQVRAEFTTWRTLRVRGTRIPEALWASAIELARTLGTNRVAYALRLDPITLRARADRGAREADAPTFVEVAPGALCSATRPDTAEGCDASPACVVEVADAGGRRLRVELHNGARDLLMVARELWALAR